MPSANDRSGAPEERVNSQTGIGSNPVEPIFMGFREGKILGSCPIKRGRKARHPLIFPGPVSLIPPKLYVRSVEES